MKVKTIEIWSSYPPPYGGVSIHSMRLFHSLENEKEFNILFKNFSKESNFSGKENIVNVKYPILEILKTFFGKTKSVHLHSNNHILWAIIGFLPFNFNYIITIHNIKLYNLKNKFLLFFVKKFLKKSKFILLNSHTLKKYLSDDLKIFSGKIIQVEAFIPPISIERGDIPPSVQILRENVEFLISGNAYMLYKDKNGEDVYGLDLLIEVINRLIQDNFNVGLVFCLPKIGDTEYWKLLEKKIQDYGISDKVLILREAVTNAFQIWEISDLFVRPTNTDIEAISIKEALSVGVKCVASDVCERPESVTLFKSRDLGDLISKIKNSLLTKIDSHYQFRNETISKIKETYKKLII